jgi:hypothetical protein
VVLGIGFGVGVGVGARVVVTLDLCLCACAWSVGACIGHVSVSGVGGTRRGWGGGWALARSGYALALIGFIAQSGFGPVRVL